MSTKHIVFLFFLLLKFNVFSQNTIRFSQFNFTKSIYNPGALASEAKFTADLIYRNQWAGVDGAPSTIAFNSAYEINSSMAVGINFYNDRIGLNQTNSISAQYAYKIQFESKKYLALGIGLGVDNVSFAYADALTISPNDPAFSQSYSKFKINTSLGLYYRSSKFYVGASIPQLCQNTMKIFGIQLTLWHYMLISGYHFKISDNFILNPNVQIKGVKNAPIQGDFLIRGISKTIGFSLGYRTENSLIAGIDLTFVNRLRIGYSINYDVGSLARTKGMSHEIYLGFGLAYNGKEIDSRRYLGKKKGFKTDYRIRYRQSRKN